MVTLVLYGVLAVVAVACLYALAVFLLPHSEQMAPPAADVAPWSLTDGPLHAEDIVDARLPVALRGYRFAETDLLLDRLTEELRLRDDEIARLHGYSLPAPSPAPTPTTAPIPDLLAGTSAADDPTSPASTDESSELPTDSHTEVSSELASELSNGYTAPVQYGASTSGYGTSQYGAPDDGKPTDHGN